METSGNELALAQIKEMGARGWRLRVEFEQDALVDDISGSAGDSNCHHRKEYDPADGHGFSVFDCMGDYKKVADEFVAGPKSAEWLALTGDNGVDFPTAVAFAHRHIMAIKPGNPY